MSNDKHFVPPGPLGFGGAPLGNMFAEISEEDADATLVAAWDAGVRHFDTAPHYGSGVSEHRFGHALRRYPRDQFVLSTKVGRLLRADESKGGQQGPFINCMPFRSDYDYTADGVQRSLEDSMQRLGMARIDIVYIHDCAEDHHGAHWKEAFRTAMEGAAVALTRLREQGVIRAWGLGVNLVEPCILALEQADPDVFLLAGRYSLLNQPALDEFFPRCVERGVHVVVGGPYNSGLIAGGTTFEYVEAPPDKVAARDLMRAIAERHGVNLRAAALQFCAAHPVVAAVIPGTKNAERVRQNAELMKQPIPTAFWQELKNSGVLPEAAPTPAG
ncbi:MAG TPA: aldo/keto reductase [Geminicoccus sp.]|jgi:D-threo-aldose 1-dehydrogenase|uniref:aldo/keto reductase n=1 Tax=Geminicoccus sp. TaxID=2024832 RepID=UPI002E350A72|nr:aldo/keto reductase [Geminicoccus sp.]HEX2527099.1 aldo/keto reductase [Geminicoccus sp.]